jgi:hypothetical protein
MPRDFRDHYIGNLKDTIYRIYHQNETLAVYYRKAAQYAAEIGDDDTRRAYISRANGVLEANETVRKYLESNGFRDILKGD